MSDDLRRISIWAVVLLVVLRISIGWHLMYEGLWKLSTLKTPNPWSAEGYLKNSTGPLRSTFRNMTGDPNDLKWLDYDYMSDKWDAWKERFLNHYPDTDKGNSKSKNSVAGRLETLMEGQKSFSAPLATLPPGIDLADVPGVHKKAIRHDAEAGKLVVDGKLHLLPIERDRLVALAEKLQTEATDGKEQYDPFIKAVKDVAKSSARLSFYERLAALLKEDRERVGLMYQAKGSAKPADDAAGAKDDSATKGVPVIVGDVDKYKNYLAFYEKQYAKARTKSDWNHLEKQWIEIQQLRRDLVGPVQALESELFAEAEELLDANQLAAGPVPPVMTSTRLVNLQTMWGLTIFGLLLMLGLFTRLSALGGAALLSLFYLAVPPWPGVQEIPSIEHNLFVNKVLIEMIALLAIAVLPSGKWFGLDAAVSVLFSRRTGKDDDNPKK